MLAVEQRAGIRERAVAQVEKQSEEEGQQHDADGNGGGNHEVGVAGAQQDEGGVERVHRIVPDQGGKDAPANHHQADDDPGDSHFEAADEEGLLRIAGVGESPDRGGKENGRPARLEILLQKGNGKCPGYELFGNRGHEADEQDHGPGKVGVDHLAVGDVGRTPGAEFFCGEVKDGLVGDEEGGHGEADDSPQEEALGAQAAQHKLLADADLVAVGAAVDRFGRRGQKADEKPRRKGAGQAAHQLSGQKAAEGLGSIVAVGGQRQIVEVGQEGEDGGDGAEYGGCSPAHVALADGGEKDRQHGDHGERQEDLGDDAGGFVVRAQLAVLPFPGLGHLEEFPEAAHLIALNPQAQPVGSPLHFEIRELVGERVVGAVPALDALGFDEYQLVESAPESAVEVVLRQAAGFALAQPRSFSVLLDEMVEADEFAGGGDADAKFLLLQFADPAVAPGPQADGIADQGAGSFEAQLALEKGLGHRVVAEYGAVAIAFQVQAAFLKEAAGLVAGLVTGDLEVYGCFGEGAVEIVASDRKGQGGNEAAGKNEEDVPFYEIPFHFFLRGRVGQQERGGPGCAGRDRRRGPLCGAGRKQHTQVQRRRRVGEGADGDQVHPGHGDLGRIVQSDIAGGFDLHA